MATYCPFRYLIYFFLFQLCFESLAAESKSSYYFKNFSKDSNFETQLALYGNSKVVHGGLSVEITGSSVSSAGKIMYKKSIKLLDVKTKSLVSFSTNFSFSLSQAYGDGLTFVMVPVSLNVSAYDGGSFGMLAERKVKVFGVQFDISKDDKHGDINGNLVGSFIFVKVSNVSSVKLVLNSGEKLQAWIDYEASSNRLEVRLTKLGHIRPVDPFLSYPIDMSLMWKEDEVLVGLSSSNGTSSGLCNVYTWGFSSRQAPHLMHSEPLDPEVHVEERKTPILHRKTDCLIKILAALIFGTACGALGALLMLFVWTIFGENGRPITPEEYAVQPVKIEYKKFEGVVDKNIEDDKR